ncbi:hypothetical protein RHODO2019_10980 [Rhodococcus antarcticus]|uniref:Uncharacterized protein n=1 Tax=Rhodococcus antarcticus TaxID=2987751 RepID=A0ABY6NWF8_9NOCA|nr:hypothetical protein [Rhodococcus antarcticus]UZJ23729.1 hypothetical protein RHODO2019_10980 [Rhodococcus antarcticus]
MKLNVMVCDVCKDRDREATSYRMTKQGKMISVDLCTEHAEPIEVLFEQVRASGVTPKRRNTRSAARVTTLEDIEKKKG